MCGISAFFNRESVVEPEIIADFIKYGETRGTDGFGIHIHTKGGGSRTARHTSIPKNYTDILTRMDYKSDCFSDLKESVIITNHRAAPETEVAVDEFNVTQTVQPIVVDDIVLSHNGSVSNNIYDEITALAKEKDGYNINTRIDSEAIIAAYLRFGRNMKATMEYLSGGFAFILLDKKKNKIYAVSTHNPLYGGYCRGYGMMISSSEEAVWDILTKLKKYPIQRCGYNIWEDYYAHMYQPNTIVEVDLDSGMTNETTFIPRYIHPNYDSWADRNSNEDENIATLVSASGGLDSTTTLAMLKLAGLNPIAIHFKYGHRGQDAEEVAINKVTSYLDIPLVKFDIEDNMKQIDNFSMLTNKDVPITTGTRDFIKTTSAWTCFRNGLFVSYMAAYAEGLILNKKANKVYYTGGFMNLTESGVYPDNSERFIQSFENFCKMASIVSDRIEPLYGLSNLLKTEQYRLLEYFRLFDELGPYLISCDDPITYINEEGELVANNCARLVDQETIPECGSGLLSYWACIRAGLKDNRSYYIKNTEGLIPDDHKVVVSPNTLDIDEIIDKILIPECFKRNLRDI